MRAGLSTIQQTLTTEAANVLNQSIADAARRNHGQTTPLHVAATLLASPTGYLRQACIRSHPNSSHPLQCRALELCFTIALERLPTTTVSAGEPPINNALMAALKRAQAHQRRGCPENQQQPLLAVKVELEQLIISILDDPSVSRVMREASFSSPAVKAAIEQSLAASPPPAAAAAIVPSPIAGLRLRPSLSPAPPQAGRNLYLNPRLQSAGAASDHQSSAARRKEDVRKVVEVLLRSKKRNPVIVGDAEPEAVARELLQMIESKAIAEAPLRNLQVVSLEKEFGSDRAQIHGKMKALEGLIDARIGSGVILDLGDLKWLVEQPSSRFAGGPIQQQQPPPPPQQQQQHLVSETGRAVVAEMANLLAKYAGGDEAVAQRLWVMGTATCETYLRCQVYHQSMENDWDLQAVPIAARAPIASVFPRIGENKMLGSALAAGVAGVGAFRRPPEIAEPKFCPSCTENYDKEMAKLGAKEEPEELARSTLPQWMQMAKLGSEKSMASPEGKEPEQGVKKKVEDLQKKWRDNCRLLHPSFHTSSVSGRPAVVNPIVGGSFFGKIPIGAAPPPPPHSLTNPKLQLAPRNHLLLQSNPPAPSPQQPSSPPTSPVRTDLVLGRPKTTPATLSENAAHGERVKDLAGGISGEWRRLDDLGAVHQNLVKQAAAMDADSFKSLFKGLSERVAWQTDAASIVATTVIQSKSGNPKRRTGQTKGDTWMLFLGPDRVGKKRMASALSDLLCRPPPVTMRLGNRSLRRCRDGADDDDDGQSDFRGKTVMDRLAEAVRRNPLSIVVLEEIDQVDMLVYAGLRRAMDRGRLVDSHGREVSLGSTIFILTSDWLPENAMKSFEPTSPRSAKIAAMAAGDCNWQLRLDTVTKTRKRRADWSSDEDDRSSRPRKESADGDGAGLSFDLNMAASSEVEEAASGGELRPPPPPRDLPEIVDETVIFRPVDFAPLRCNVVEAITAKFSEAACDCPPAAIEVDDDALDRIVGGVWFGRTGLEEWVNRVLLPGFRRLRSGPDAGVENGSRIVRLVASERGPSWEGDGGDGWLPSRVSVDSV